MMKIANTPNPPYYAVIFTSVGDNDSPDYKAVSERMVELVEKQSGFLGFESAKEEVGITVSYWKDEKSILNWRNNLEHQEAQEIGKERFYKAFKVRVAKIERAYSFEKK